MAKRYVVLYELDESGWWVATVDKLPGCLTQGRSIAQARKRIREALAAWLDDEAAAKSAELIDDIDLSKLGQSSIKLVEAVHKERKNLEALKRNVARDQAKAARKLSKAGLSVRDVGEVLGLSHQRVQQLLEQSNAA
jgi:predicted RNase H-like HicB family nuclease